MAYTQLTVKGKNYIKKNCSGSGNSLLRGKNKYVLPYTKPTTSSSKIWISDSSINGGITTNAELGDALIKWYEKYCEIYEIDANIVVAQAYQESAFKIWNYAGTSTASGISQFIAEAIYDIIIKNRGKVARFSPIEIAAITKNISGDTKIVDTYKVSTALGKYNRPILHQNIINNPELMIKAQCRFIKKIAQERSSLASNVLFGYNRGPGYVRKSYSDSIQRASRVSTDYEKEGVDYVWKIFNNLYTNFGYTQLNMKQTPNTFNDNKADVDSSEQYN